MNTSTVDAKHEQVTITREPQYNRKVLGWFESLVNFLLDSIYLGVLCSSHANAFHGNKLLSCSKCRRVQYKSFTIHLFGQSKKAQVVIQLHFVLEYHNPSSTRRRPKQARGV